MRSIKHAADLFQNRRTLWQMLKDVLNGSYKMSFATNIAVLLSVLYVLFPFDLVTDLLPILGWTDDGFVIFLLIKRLQKETQRYNRHKAMTRKSGF